MEIRQRATEPTLGYEERLTPFRLLPNDLLELSLRAYEQDAVAAHHHLAHQVLGQLDLTKGLLEIDEIDPGPLGENKPPHLGIPSPRLVPKMDASF